MGAPTWPPTPEHARRATLEEYGDDARAVLADDEQAERALLARFLFAPPPRQFVTGEAAGTPLHALRRSLEAWLRMVSGRPVAVGVSDPPATDGVDVYLPGAAPPPVQPAEDTLLYRVMALGQLGLVHFGLLDDRRLLVEVHRDWVLRSAWHLLALRYVARRWGEQFPGMRQDFDAVRFLDKACTLRVNLASVPARGMPQGFLPLYEGLVDFVEPAGSEGAAARKAVAAVDGITDPRAARAVILGQAWALRVAYRERRLGPPPLPWYAGVLRPEWMLEDVVAARAAQDEWKLGPKPLRLLRDVVRAKGGESIPARVRRLLKAPAAALPDLSTTEDVARPEQARPEQARPEQARPEQDGSREYDEWDDAQGVVRLAATRVVEVEAPGGPLESYTRIVEANQAEIRAVRRRFAALAAEERWLHGQPDGTELDLNRVVAALADIQAGHTPRLDWFLRFQRRRQSVSILTLVDLSGSTQGNVIRLQQEALVIFAEGLQAVGFPHAMFGFSNQGARDCRFHRIKGWDEPLGEPVQKRMGTLRPGGSTRLGAFLRHGAWELGRRLESRRVMLVISDGRPHDRDGYVGEQAVADAAMAVLEARRQGVHLHCISLDTHETAEAYLRRIFGPGRYLLLDRLDALPERLPEVFRALVR